MPFIQKTFSYLKLGVALITVEVGPQVYLIMITPVVVFNGLVNSTVDTRIFIFKLNSVLLLI